ncbi:hypothetical protein OI70_18930 [Dickeya fangzhongdai]|nr:hypothetical protein OI70_18930 [Dickeya fangzhongdai]
MKTGYTLSDATIIRLAVSLPTITSVVSQGIWPACPAHYDWALLMKTASNKQQQNRTHRLSHFLLK